MTTDDSQAAVKRLIELQTDETTVLLRQTVDRLRR